MEHSGQENYVCLRSCYASFATNTSKMQQRVQGNKLKDMGQKVCGGFSLYLVDQLFKTAEALFFDNINLSQFFIPFMTSSWLHSGFAMALDSMAS
jgi:hypothetical protein